MKTFLTVIAMAMLVGCTSPATYVSYPSGMPIRVTAGYDIERPQRHVEGDEFVFSIMLPRIDEWRYSPQYDTADHGMLTAEGVRSRNTLFIEWIWITKTSPETLRTLEVAPIYLPWYSGQKGDGSRIMYTPSEKQIKSGDWYSVGYPRRLFHQSVYRGVKNYYCLRSVITRGGRTSWDQEQGVPDGASYPVFYTCPFRTTDGRDAYFKISTAFWVSAEEFQSNPNVVEDNLEALDEFLKPSWDSLEVTPLAYQFEPPEQAVLPRAEP